VWILAFDIKKYTRRTEKQFNRFRAFWQFVVCKIIYMIWYKVVYRLEVHGTENIPRDNNYIACGNHLSALDPPLICAILHNPVSFIAKKELFEKPFMRWWMDWLGAFAVNRDKPEPSTIKTALSIKNTRNWVLALFPQGTREDAGVIKNVSKGFANFAKASKCGILPIGIVGTQTKKKIPFTGKIIVNIGEVIPYSDDVDEVVQSWIKSVEALTGFKYEGSTNG